VAELRIAVEGALVNMEPHSARAAAAEVTNLSVALHSGSVVLEDVSLAIAPGEILGVAGESGSGKTTLGLALLGYARQGMRIVSGTLRVGDHAVSLGRRSGSQTVPGHLIAYVPQDPATSLNPSLRIGQILQDVLPAATKGEDIHGLLAAMQLPATRAFTRRFPHQLSGGQQQRVLIACALASRPRLVVLDEPTTGLDVVTQKLVLEEIARLRQERDLAMVYISHDLAVVSELADRVAVIYSGRLVEVAPTRDLVSRPKHPYTRGLLAAVPDIRGRIDASGIPGLPLSIGDRPVGCAFAPRCGQRIARCELETPMLEQHGRQGQVACFEAFRTPPMGQSSAIGAAPRRTETELLVVEALEAIHRQGASKVVAASGVSFTVGRGECVALVGESGSGKTTIARAIVGLHKPAGGQITLDGVLLHGAATQRTRAVRQSCQIIFQNPYESLNPRRSVEDQVARPGQLLRGLSRAASHDEVKRLLALVRLPERVARKYPGELSGGERQRIAVARALAAEPKLLICDEVTSALDVSVQAAVLDLLSTIRAELNLALLFITHNLGVVANISDRILILQQGSIVEDGAAGKVLAHPKHSYTQQLVDATPSLWVPDLANASGRSAGQP
jgi:peptide/nickel transport system ATP-binding protein